MSSKPSGRSSRSGTSSTQPSRHASLRLLIQRIDVAPDGISVTLHAAWIRSLVAELADQELPAVAVSEPVLEAGSNDRARGS